MSHAARDSNAVRAGVIIANRDRYPPAEVEAALRWLDKAVSLSFGKKKMLVIREGRGTLRPDDPERKQIMTAEIYVYAFDTITERTRTIEAAAGRVPVLRFDLSPHDGQVLLPLKIWSAVIKTLRAHLSKETDMSPRGYHWEPRLETEPLR